jgi:hypothetical protein
MKMKFFFSIIFTFIDDFTLNSDITKKFEVLDFAGSLLHNSHMIFVLHFTFS